METPKTILETTLTMLGANEYIPQFKKYDIDSSILPLLTDNDLKIIGMEDEKLRNKFIKQCANLPCTSECTLEMKVDDKYVTDVINDIDRHLLLLDASLSYALNYKDLKYSDIKVHNVTQCVVHCSNTFEKELRTFHSLFVRSKNKKKHQKWKYAVLAVISATASVFIFKKLL